jgi:hypothetical protein
MKHRGFNATVNTPTSCANGYNNLPLAEYPAKDAVHENAITTYVEAHIGKQFSISVENESTHDASVVFYVDGQMASVLLCYAKPKHNVVNCLGVQPEAGLLQRFVFSKANLSGLSERNQRLMYRYRGRARGRSGHNQGCSEKMCGHGIRCSRDLSTI